MAEVEDYGASPLSTASAISQSPILSGRIRSSSAPSPKFPSTTFSGLCDNRSTYAHNPCTIWAASDSCLLSELQRANNDHDQPCEWYFDLGSVRCYSTLRRNPRLLCHSVLCEQLQRCGSHLPTLWNHNRRIQKTVRLEHTLPCSPIAYLSLEILMTQYVSQRTLCMHECAYTFEMCVCVLQSVCCSQSQRTDTNTHPCESYKKTLLFFVTRSFYSKSTHMYEIIRSLRSAHIPSIVSHHSSRDHRRWLFSQEHGDSYDPIILLCCLVSSSNIHQMKLHCDFNLYRMSEVVDALGNL